MFQKYFSVPAIVLLTFLASNALAEDGNAVWRPPAKEYDWVQLTSGEWLKGEIKSMYSETLEFDSDKLDLLSIDMDDVQYLKSHIKSNVNLETTGPTTGMLQISGEQITITSGENVKKYDRIELISFTPAGDREIDLWAIKFTLGLNVRSGNTQQVDYTAKFSAKRRTAKSRFITDYIGNISKTDAGTGAAPVETINNHRLTSSLDIYATRYFFYTPVFGEYFRDPFQNIDQRFTLGAGIGYTIYDTGKIGWDINAGPAFLTTSYLSVQPGEDATVDAAALVLGTNFDIEITSTLDFIFKYDIQASKKEAGGYTHNITATFENDLTGRLELDVTVLWYRISIPTEDDQGIVPEPDDFWFILGVTYTF